MQLVSSSPRPRVSSGILFLVGLAALISMALLSNRLFLSNGNPTVESSSAASDFSRLPLAFAASRDPGETAVQFEVLGQNEKISFAPQAVTFEVQGQAVQLNFINNLPDPEITAGERLPGIINDFRGGDEAQWATQIPTYSSLSYGQLYPGIDLYYQGTDGLLKSTFTVAAGADPARIQWRYDGVTTLAVDETSGDLLITLPDQSQLVEKAPIAWQEIDGQRVPVTAAFALTTGNNVGFTLGNYNPNLPLTIDPTIVYENTFNVGDFGRGLDITIDDAGNTYILGLVLTPSNDAFVAKLSPDGTLLYVTYLGGSAVDFGGGIALDGAGDVYVAGGTDSADFPILNAMIPDKNGVTRDAFIAKLAGENGTLLFSTYYGGSRSDSVNDITLNAAGEIYVVGQTESTDFPTVNPIQGSLNLNNCFCEDTFVSRLSPDALTVLYSTYLGGGFEDYGQSIALDGGDNIYVTGRTQSDDFPTHSAIQPNRAGTNQDEDLFVSKISADGSSLVFSTYLGGRDYDSVRRIAVDSAGNAFVGGSTLSDDFPTTAGAYSDTYIGGSSSCLTGFGLPTNCNDMFVTKIVPDGSSLAYSTYLGGTRHDYANGIAINDAGEAYVVGYTTSADFPGVTDTGIIMAKLNADGNNLLSAISIPSAVSNAGHGIAVDDAGDVIITGAQDAPSNLYVAKISDDGTAPPPPPPTTSNMHVGDLDGSSSWVRRNRQWQATVTITIHDENHDPLAGATVSGSWSGGEKDSDQCTTSSDGSCTVTTGRIRRKAQSAIFTVGSVTHPSFTYAGGDNHDLDGGSNGTMITVSRP